MKTSIVKTNYHEFIVKNQSKIIMMKAHECNVDQFVALMPDGELRVKNHSDHFTTGPVATFGGTVKNEKEARRQLIDLINEYDGVLYEKEIEKFI